MGKPTGFIEYIRELPSELAPIDRIRNWTNSTNIHHAEIGHHSQRGQKRTE